MRHPLDSDERLDRYHDISGGYIEGQYGEHFEVVACRDCGCMVLMGKLDEHDRMHWHYPVPSNVAPPENQAG